MLIRCPVLRLAALAGLMAWAGCGRAPEAEGDALVLFSPHSDEIEAEFERAFKAHYRAETGREVTLSWPDAGGTTQMLRRIQDKFAAGRTDVDVVFGGGPIFERMKQLAFLEPCALSPEVMEGLPETVAGQPLYDPEGHWYGAAISTFGLIFNTKVIADRALPPVESWDVMADRAYHGLVGAGDPTKSGSLRKAYEIILQAYGYERGMGILVRMGANAREFYEGASDIPRACARGFVAVGPCIDFYAQRQKLAEGGEHIGFTSPKGLTVVNCDPIGILRGAPNRAVAERFVAFVMSEAGQRLWMTLPGAPGGPAEHSLERLAVRPALYDETAAIRYAMNPFTMPPADFFEAEKEHARLAILPDYLYAAIVENHGPLREAWPAVEGRPELEARLVEPLLSEDEMLGLGRTVWTPVVVPDEAAPEAKADAQRREEARRRRQSDLRTEWSETLRARYREIREAARP